MRILVLSNFYPPHFIGGYELGCREVVEGLRARAHELFVLTSDYGISANAVPEPNLLRRFRLVEYPEQPRGDVRAVGRHNLDEFRKAVASFQPDMIYAWKLHSLGAGLIREIEELPFPHAYYVSDLWMLGEAGRVSPHLERRPKHSVHRRLKSLFATASARLAGERMPRQFTNLQCCSRFILDQIDVAGAAAGECEAIYWGIEPEKFANVNRPAKIPPRLLYLGQIERHKGVHTAIRAFSIIHKQMPTVTLTIAGGPLEHYYGRELRRLADETGTSAITLAGKVSSRELNDVFAQHDILLFPSESDEPFAITPLEAMASGLAVVATTTGGSAEIFENNVNSMTFKAGNPDDCARQTLRLLRNPALTERIACSGRELIRRKFTLTGMLDRIDHHLGRVLEARTNRS